VLVVPRLPAAPRHLPLAMASGGPHPGVSPRRTGRLRQGVTWHWGDVRHAVENPIDQARIRSARPFLEVIDSEKRSGFFGRRTGDELIDGHIIPSGQLPNLSVQGIRQTQTQVAHDALSILPKNSPGVAIHTGNGRAPAKSRTLCVTMASHPAAIASSRMNSSRGSLNAGRHRK
jgi:hypothetical protein